MKLAINLATRGRPELLLKTIEQTTSNIREENTMFVISIDEDDDATIQVAMDKKRWAHRATILIKAREDTIADKWNRILKHVPDADVYMPMCDDGPVITPGFDTMILTAAAQFPDNIGVVTNYLENLTFPGIQAVTGKMARLMGHIYPPLFPYWFVDHWLLDISRMIGRDWFVDVKLDCATNRPPTMEFREPSFWATYYDMLASERHRIADELFFAMIEPSRHWHERMLASQWPKWDQHSRMINDGVRAQYGLSKGPEPDERYLRMRRAAIAHMRTFLAQQEAA